MRLHRFKPGSIINDKGDVVDWNNVKWARGPCFIPSDISAARKGALGEAGWHVTPVTHWPGIMPTQGLFCIHRGPLS